MNETQGSVVLNTDTSLALLCNGAGNQRSINLVHSKNRRILKKVEMLNVVKTK